VGGGIKWGANFRDDIEQFPFLKSGVETRIKSEVKWGELIKHNQLGEFLPVKLFYK